MKADYIRAHDGAGKKEQIAASKSCGCFYCLNVFPPTHIKTYTRDDYAVCPMCGIDSVLGDAGGFPVLLDFLRLMKKHWFESSVVDLSQLEPDEEI